MGSARWSFSAPTGGVARIMLTALFAAALAERGLLTIARLSAKVAGNERAER
jgi:hypothetical protein